MTSIRTNTAAMAAVQMLRSVSENLSKTQSQVSSGMRVGSASDNVAYWSISTTMKSDKKAISAASDALGLGAAKVDTAYSGLASVRDILSEFKAKLVTATETSADKSKIQQELDNLKQQVVRIAQSASFSGENWLNTKVADLDDISQRTATVVSAFVRDESGSVSVKSMDVDLSKVSLFNTTGGGLLQAAGSVSALPGSGLPSTAERYFVQAFYTFSGPITFSSSDAISFDTIISPGGSEPDAVWPATITRTDVSAALGGRDTIADANEMARVLDRVYARVGVDIRSGVTGRVEPGVGDVWTGFYPGVFVSDLSGANFQIVNVSSTFAGGAAGGLENGENYVRSGTIGGSSGSDSGGTLTNPNRNLLDIDIELNPSLVAEYLSDIETMSANVINAAAILGSGQQRIQMQSVFATKLTDTITSGVSRLVDTDMEEASARLSALQTQQQLANQSLSIANSYASNIVTLFK